MSCQVVYFWVNEKIGFLKNAGFNFHQRYKFKYNSSAKQLFVNEENNINIFEEYVLNVSVIVGENGSGKTAFFRTLLHTLTVEGKGTYELRQYVIVLYDSAEDDFFICTNEKLKIKTNNRIFSKINFIKHEALKNIFMPIYYTEAFNVTDYNYSHRYRDINEFDLSLSHRIYMAGQDVLSNNIFEKDDKIRSFYFEESEKQLACFNDIELPFDIIALYINPLYLPDFRLMLYERLKELHVGGNLGNGTYVEALLKVVENRRTGASRTSYGLLIKSVAYALLGFVLSQKQIALEDIRNLAHKWERLDTHPNNDRDFLESLINETLTADFKWDEHPRYIGMLNRSLLLIIRQLFDENIVKSDGERFFIWKAKNRKKEIWRIYKNFSLCVQYGMNRFLCFDWAMSTGERAYFNLFAQINYFIKKFLAESVQRTVLLMLDEIDLYMHPRWQQEGLHKLLIYMKKVFPLGNVQIIFGTHSPIMLSDVPLSNSIYLENGKIVDKGFLPETFAANIYNIYAESFFLNKRERQNAIWIHGTFARLFLEGLQKELDRLCVDLADNVDLSRRDEMIPILESLLPKIKLIGDKLLRDIMNMQYERVRQIMDEKLR